MKIYFEDGPLRPNSVPKLLGSAYLIAANDGVESNLDKLDYFYKTDPNCSIYTNSILALTGGYGWNNTKKQHDIFLRVGETGHFSDFMPIQYLTNRELREGHNIMKMYVAGEFENGIEGTRKVNCHEKEMKEWKEQWDRE